MKKISINDEMHDMPPCVATIGFFDGVHRGHQYLISHLVKEAESDGLESMVITFDEHPRKVLQSDYQPQMLSSLDEKLLLLSKTDVDSCTVLHFDRDMASMSAYDFMKQILLEKLNVRKLFIGYDHRFGCNRAEGFDDYVRHGKELGIEVKRNRAFLTNGVNVSSSVIRNYLQKGQIEMAEKCLGYPYTLAGRVMSGYQLGRKLGFPTANIDTSGWDKMIPAPGVYAVKVRVQNTMEMKRGMMNIGTRPTFDGDHLALEVHILNFHEDLYGKILLVSFLHRIREERKFSSERELVAQLKEDELMVEKQFDKDLENE